MADNMESHLDSRAQYVGPARLPDWMMPVLLGLAAGVAAALFVTVHWTVAVMGALIVLVLSAVENETFLLAVIFLLPLSWVRPEGILRDVMTPFRILVLFGFFTGRLWRGNLGLRRLWSSRVSRASALFFALAVGSVVVGPVGWGHDSLAQCYKLASWVGFYFFALTWIDSRRRLLRVLAALLASVCILGAFSIVQEAVRGYTSLWFYLNPPGPDFIPWNGRAPSLVSYSTSLAGYLGIILPFALASWIAGEGRLRRLGRWAFILGSISLIFSQSIGGLLSFGFVLVLSIYLFVKSWHRRLFLFAGLVAICGGFYFARHILNPAHFAAAAGSLPPDVIIRLLQFHAAWVLFLQHPFLGVGFGNYGMVSVGLLPQASWMPSSSLMASNLYLTLLAETGIIGVLAFLYPLFWVGRIAWRRIRTCAFGFSPVFAFGTLGAVSAVLIHGCVDDLFFYAPQYGTLLWLVLALSVVSSRIGYANRRKTFSLEVGPECE